MAFELHNKRYYAPLVARTDRGATINGRPAWQVAEERRAAAANNNAMRKDA